LRRAESAGLQDASYRHDGCANQDRLLAPEPLPNSEGHDGTKETTNIVDGCDDGEQVGFRWSIEIQNVQVILGDIHTTVNTLVV